MDIPIPTFIQHPEKIYHKEILLKKETSKVWTEYYAVLCDHYLIFNRKNSQNGNIIPNDCTILELTPNSKVLYTRKKCYRFPFEIEMNKLKYSFKCETNLQRYRWVFAIRLAIEGKPPKTPPKFVPTRYSRGRMAKKEDKPQRRPSRSSISRSEQGSRISRSSLHNGSTENGFYLNARHNVVDLTDESDLNHSSTAVRLQASKNALLLTNKGAFTVDEATAIAKYKEKPRRASYADNDLHIVDFDDDDDNDDNHNNKSRESIDLHTSVETLTIDDDGRKTKSSEILGSENSESINYRLYPDNMKSYSWTSFGILRKTPANRQHSAPSTSHRYQRPPLKVTFSPSTK